jgi:hypothetical protein
MLSKTLVLGTVALGMLALTGSAHAQFLQFYTQAAPYIANYTANAYNGSLYYRPAISQFNSQYVYPSIRQGANYAFGNFHYVTTPMIIRRR